jgi:DNA-binding transcriptional ArsR family regulator
MEPAGRAQGPDFAKLAGYLDALANPARLELLHLLRQPRAVGDLQLRPSGTSKGSPERNITRQAVRKHLAKLEDAGLVVTQGGRREGLAVEERVVNHQMLYALLEELRRTTQVTPYAPIAGAATMTESGRQGARGSAGARLIVVHGAREGQTFPLSPTKLAGDRGWVIGRGRDLPVGLDYDPFISQEHAEVLAVGDGFELRDLRSNKNGTELNWEALPRGGAATLVTGDVVGVGRSLLLFRAT